jgi:fibronectin type 3 domain-containing protein
MIKYFWSTIFSLSILYFAKVNTALAQVADDLGVNDLSNTNLGTRELTDTVALLINVFLGLLGTIAVVLIIYGGWMWMTSQGNAEKVQKAKLILTSAIIGLVIILASYAIARFVLNNIYDATGGGGPVGDPPPYVPPWTISCDTPDDTNTVKICKIRPDDTGGPVGQYIIIEGWNFDTYGANSQVRFDGPVNVAAELISCNGVVRWENWYTSGGHTYYRIKAVIPSVPFDDYKVEVHADDGNASEYPEDPAYFEVRAGDPGPGIACITPDAQFRDLTVDIEGVNFGALGSINIQGWDDANEEVIDIQFLDWDDWSNTFIDNAKIPLAALSSDLFIRAGGLDSAPEYFQVLCNDADADCASGCCVLNSCRESGICLEYAAVADGPFIDHLSPDKGAEGNLITVYGSGFGDSPGLVLFEADDGGVKEGNLNISGLNPNCSSLWTDSAILVEVPAGIKDGDAKVWVKHESSEESNTRIYDDTFGQLPGICLADPDNGAFGEDIILHGIKFQGGDKASFGEVLDHNTDIVSDLLAKTKVPNILPGEIGVWLHRAADKDGNALPFTVNAVAGGDPVIHDVSPNTGPKGQYLTVRGANFGNVQGQLNFILGADSTQGDIPQCADSYWQDSSIVIKVPNIPDNDYQIQVERNIDSKVSNLYDFEVILGAPGPGLCALEPDNGPVNFSPVNLYGDNFGTTDDRVYFFDGVSTTTLQANINDWFNDNISVSVPDGAMSGSVIVQQGTKFSNSLDFTVGSCSADADCAAGRECCIQDIGNYCAPIGDCPGSTSCQYTWTVTTVAEPFGLQQHYQCENNLQSPSPWPDITLDGHQSRDAYLDSNIIALFTRDVQDADFAAANIKILPCNIGGEFDNASCGANVSGSVNIINQSSDAEGFIFSPDTNFEHNRWYKVALGTFHSEIGNDTWNGATFDWHFRTQDALCQVDEIQVTPAMSPQADIYVGHTRDFYASPQGDNCNICGGNYNWEPWILPNLDDFGRADIIDQDFDDINISWARLEGAEVTENDSDNSIVELQAELDGWKSRALPKIKEAVLQIIDYGPDCNESCDNALVWVKFNTVLDTTTVNDTNFSIEKCIDDSCIATDGHQLIDDFVFDADGAGVAMKHNSFAADSYYQVLVSNNVQNIAGYNLTPAFKWNFGTSGDEDCIADRIGIDPAYRISTVLEEDINYIATPYSAPNSCNTAGQPLDAADYDAWDWSINDDSIASLDHHDDYAAVAHTHANGTAFIKAEIVAPAPPHDPNSINVPPGNATLIVNQTPDITYDAPTIISSAPDTPACLNAALVFGFDKLMDINSLSVGIELYEKDSLSADPGCVVFGADQWCPVDGHFSFANPIGTRATFYSNELLKPNTDYFGLVSSIVRSTDGINLDPTILNFDFDGDHNDDSYRWEFTTNDQMCQVSFVTVEPSPDLFSCSRSNCPDDVNGALPGNQHQYTATAKDPTGTVLNMEEYNWFEHNDLLDLVDDEGTSIQATAHNQNGTTSLVVEVSDPMAGSAIGQAYINLFLCENPWPSIPADFPYDFDGSGNNFSTYYCQDSGIGGETILPYLSDPIRPFPSGLILEEFIFVVDPTITAMTDSHLADQQSESWWQKFIAKFRNKALAVPPPPPNSPTDLELVDNGGDGVVLQWMDQAPNEAGFNVYRKSSTVDWMKIAEVDSALDNPVEFVDTGVIAGEVYSYRVSAFNDTGGESNFTDVVTVTAAVSSVDVIGVRVMKNLEHLSVKDWYDTYAPNPEISGQLFEADGYQAMQVGNTVYISAANVVDPSIWTNIYIISHNIGARESTREIFDGLLDNMAFSTNIDSTNVCQADATRSCQSKFDCADLVPATCDADGLQLRRDTQRLNDLIEIKGLLDDYGQSYKACSNNSNISCTDNAQCPDGGTCVPYYPLLNSGTYVNGTSVTRWPSWQEEFSQVLATSNLPQDPINRFTGCPDNTDPDTCWDDLNSAFHCPVGSLIYLYKKGEPVNDYSLDANFEFNSAGTDFENGLNPPIDSKIQFNNDDYCDNMSTVGGGVDALHCGDGIVDLDGPDDILGNEDDEDCDGNFRNLCDAMLFEANWWDEQLGGCYPPGTLDPDSGELIECTWYVPEPALDDPAQCGNYCGDGDINSVYESCDEDDFGGIDYGCPAEEDLFCHPSQCYVACDGGSEPTICGDAIWDEAGGEECDASADPNGLEGWSCSEGGTLSCNSCNAECTEGDAYLGACNDGSVDDPPEECEPISHDQPLPIESSAANQYACGAADTPQACLFQGGWCGDGDPQSGYDEECDWYNYPVLDPADSDSDNQYACSDACLFEGGWCGDGDPNGPEDCDGTDIACNIIDPIYTAGWAECGAPAEPNACTVVDTAACCNLSSLSAKFLADNTFDLFVNGHDVGSGNSWPGNPGAYEFNITAPQFDISNDNIIAFHAHDVDGSQGVIGTFSCQTMTCQSVCYKGSNAGGLCTTSAQCPDGGTCVHPATGKEDEICQNNAFCKPYEREAASPPDDCTRDDCVNNPWNDWENKPSLCVPEDFGITTRNDGLWKCTINDPVTDDWKTDPLFIDDTWFAAHEYAIGDAGVGNFNNQTDEAYWRHMVPGAAPIWGSADAGDDDVWCRYVIAATVPPIPMPPAAPSDLVGVADSDAQITISWQDNSWNESGFQVNRDDGFVTLLPSNTTSYSDTGLSADTGYVYEVRAYNENEPYDSDWSNSVFVTTQPLMPPDVPAAPTNLREDYHTETDIALLWDDNSNNENGFYLLQQRLDGDGNVVAETDHWPAINSEGLTILSLLPETTYRYYIAAYNDEGSSDYSDPVEITTNAAPVLATIFVTSAEYNGNLQQAATNLGWEPHYAHGNWNGLEAADYICQHHADSAPAGNVRPGIWRAWLSSAGYAPNNWHWNQWHWTDPDGFADRFTHNTTPYQLPSGDIVANDWNDLIDVTGLSHAINITEEGSEIPESSVRTHTTPYGEEIPFADDCDSFSMTGNTLTPKPGKSDSTGLWGWTNNAMSAEIRCSTSVKLYCFWQEGLPLAPSDLVEISHSSDSVTIGWTDNSDNELGFGIAVYRNGLGGDIYNEFADSNDTSVTLFALPGNNYFYKISAYNEHGNSPWSDFVEITTD